MIQKTGQDVGKAGTDSFPLEEKTPGVAWGLIS
jgi:hypothetical protein